MERLTHTIAVVILLRARVAIVLGTRRVTMRSVLNRNRPPHIVAHGRQVLGVAMPVRRRLPVVPLSTVLWGLRHA